MGFEPVEKDGAVAGHFVRAENTSRHLAVFLPPATGRLELQMDEARHLAMAGVNALVLIPPYVRLRNGGPLRGLESPEGEKRFWDRNVEEIASVLEEIRERKGLTGSTICLGKNLGGSYGAYSASRCRFDYLFAYGSIPMLSVFWSRSDHPVARSFRAGKETLLPAFVETMRSMDLIGCFERNVLRGRLQLGSRDEWIDGFQREALDAHPAVEALVRWYDDDHEMEEERTRAERYQTVMNLLK